MNWFEEAMNGIEQGLEAIEHLKASTKFKSNFIPAYTMWEAKEQAYKEIANLLAMIAKRDKPYETHWEWK